MRCLTVSSIEKNCFCTGTGLRQTQAATWAIVWAVHSRRKKLAVSLSHMVCRVLRSWQHSWGSSELSREACSRWKAGRFFTVKPRQNKKRETLYDNLRKCVKVANEISLNKGVNLENTILAAWQNSLSEYIKTLSKMCLVNLVYILDTVNQYMKSAQQHLITLQVHRLIGDKQLVAYKKKSLICLDGVCLLRCHNCEAGR